MRTLNQLGRIVTGKTPLSSRPEYFGGDIPFVTPTDFDGRRIIGNTGRYLTEEGAGSVAGSRIPARAVMVSCIGSDMGKAAITGRDCVTNQQINSILVTSENDALFVYYNLSSRKVEIRTAAGGSAQPILNKSAFGQLEILLPTLDEQRAIAHILGTLDDKIELNRRMNESLEAMARAIFKSWFVDFDPVRAKAEGRDPGLPKLLADLFPDSFENSELGEIPKGWRVEWLSDVMTFQGGSQPPASEFISQSRDGYVRLVQIRDFYTSSHITYVPDTPKLRKFTRDDVMIARYGSSGGADKSTDSLARICRGLSGAYNVALVKVVPHRPIREYLLYFLQSPAFQSVIRGMGARSVQSGFRKADLDVIPVVTASAAVHRKFEELAGRIWHRCFAADQESKCLAAVRDALLPKLVSGELRIEDAKRFLSGSE